MSILDSEEPFEMNVEYLEAQLSRWRQREERYFKLKGDDVRTHVSIGDAYYNAWIEAWREVEFLLIMLHFKRQGKEVDPHDIALQIRTGARAGSKHCYED